MVRIPESESFGGMKAERETTGRRLDDIERTDGSQYARALEKIKALVAQVTELLTQIDVTVQAAINQYSMTRAAIIDYVSGLTWLSILPPGKGGTGTSNAHNNDLATTNRRAAWVSEAGVLGFALSTFKRKANLQEASIPVDAWLGLPVQTFQYRDADGELAGWDFGFIAEDVAALGLEQWVYRGHAGGVEGVAYERLMFVHHEALRRHVYQIAQLREDRIAQSHQIKELSARLTALESKE